ncbi:MAG: choline-sulfatase [Myxococcota bacterium]|jgi:choline-sulfatase
MLGWMLWGCAAPEVVSDHPNIIVIDIDIDTLSADRVGVLRDGRSITPTMDALAAQGTRYTSAYSQAGWTLPALTALLTGRYPAQVQAVGGRLSWRPDGARDLAGILSMYDYDTAAFFGSTVPGPMMQGVEQGFAHYAEGGRGSVGADVDRWLATAEEPFFALVHEVDLHIRDERAPRGTVHRFAPGRRGCARGGHFDVYRRIAQHRGPAEAAEHVIAHYDGLLSWYDEVLAAHLDALDARGVAERTIVVVTSDHGEDLFVHAYGDHGILYDTVLRVPLIVYDPREPAGGKVVDTPVQTIDLAPTLLSLAGLPVDTTMDGLPLDGALPDERPIFSLTNRTNASLRSQGFKLVMRDMVDERVTTQGGGLRWRPAMAASNEAVLDILDAARGETPSDQERYAAAGLQTAQQAAPTGGIRPERVAEQRMMELYELATDPSELDNVLDAHPARGAAMAEALGQWLGQREADRPRVVTDDQRSLLQDAGYWGMVAGEAEP